MHTYIHMCIYVYTYVYIHTYVHTYIHIYIYIYIHTYIHTHVYMYMYTYIYIYIYTYLFILFIYPKGRDCASVPAVDEQAVANAIGVTASARQTHSIIIIIIITHDLTTYTSVLRLTTCFLITSPGSPESDALHWRDAVHEARWGLEYLDLLRDILASELTSQGYVICENVETCSG